MSKDARAKKDAPQRELVYRQNIWTRICHWAWAVCLFFLLLSGLQIFNAHPSLYIGQQSGFGFNNAVLTIEAVDGPAGPRGRTTILGHSFDTTGVFGISGAGEDQQYFGVPAALTIPSDRDLATGRIIHFFVAWMLIVTLVVWLSAGLLNGHIRRDLIATQSDIQNFPRDVAEHLRFRFHHGRSYNALQKLSYSFVLFVLLPLMVITGLTMSPGIDAALPWLTEIFGGRQSARTIHFLGMLLLVGFFCVHIVMVFAAGPFNELRSIVTGWYRADANTTKDINS